MAPSNGNSTSGATNGHSNSYSNGYSNGQTNGQPTGHSNGRSRTLQPGVYVPTVAFFDPETEDVDVAAVAAHAVRLARAGLTGITTQGSNGEAVHLDHDERQLITRRTREALDAAGFHSMPIIVGCGAQSTREAIQLTRDAKASGGDYALVLPPSYFKASYTSHDILTFFEDVATASPVPILIYNYPGAAAGTDLTSDDIIRLAQHPNIVGCKLTCGNTGKLARIASATHAATAADGGSGFMCMGGSADFTLQTMIAGGSGVVTGLGNVVPKACVRVFDLYARGKVAEAQKAQAIVARGDWAVIKHGITGTKTGLQSYFGYGGYARRPLPRFDAQQVADCAEALREVVELEKSL